MGAVKQAMLLGSGDNSIVTTEAYAISGEFDIDALGGIMNFNLPYLTNDQKNVTDSAGVDITRLKRFDTVKLYYGEFERDFDLKANSESDIIAAGLLKMFDGFVDTIKLNKSKDNFTYGIGALGTIGLANYRTMEWEKKNDLITNMVRIILQLSALDDIIPFESTVPEDRIPVNLDGGKTSKDFLMQLREKYAVILHQGGDGILKLETAEIFAQNATTTVYEFDFREGNIFDLDYGDIGSNYNAVLVLGFPPNFGIALDAIAVDNNNGQVNYLGFENRDIKSNETCEEVARNKLLELERNFAISFRTALNPKFRIGQAFTLFDNDRYTGNEKFLIKKFTFTIDKQDSSATVTGYTHSLTLLPENIVLSNTGIADIDILELRPKINDDIGWGAQLNQ